MKLRTLVLALCLLQMVGCTDRPKAQWRAKENTSSLIADDRTAYDTRNWEDGTRCAEVEYHNSSTGYSAIYRLEVEIEYGCVTTIYFPNGGRLDDEHIDAAELDSEGTASFEDDEGHEWKVQLIDDSWEDE